MRSGKASYCQNVPQLICYTFPLHKSSPQTEFHQKCDHLKGDWYNCFAQTKQVCLWISLAPTAHRNDLNFIKNVHVIYIRYSYYYVIQNLQYINRSSPMPSLNLEHMKCTTVFVKVFMKSKCLNWLIFSMADLTPIWKARALRSSQV